MRCCPVLLSLYCYVIVFLNEINGYGDGEGFEVKSCHSRVSNFLIGFCPCLSNKETQD